MEQSLKTKVELVENLKEQLEQERKEKVLYRDLLHGYLGLVKLERRDLPNIEKKDLKSIKLSSKTFASKRAYLEDQFRPPEKKEQ